MRNDRLLAVDDGDSAPGASVLGALFLHSGSSAARRRYSASTAAYTRAISAVIDRLAQSSFCMGREHPARIGELHAIPAAEIAAARSAA